MGGKDEAEGRRSVILYSQFELRSPRAIFANEDWLVYVYVADLKKMM